LSFAQAKVLESAQKYVFSTVSTPRLTFSPDLHSPQTTANLLALLVAPITSYLSVLTLLAIPSYTPLLSSQPYSTRMAIGQAVVSSVLKNNTLIETSEDVSGVLGLCAVLVRDQKDSTAASGPRGRQAIDYREMAEEQGWVARMVHLFKSEDLAVQFEVC
jgi:vacuolar protein sorting-associated protein 35